MIDVRDVSVRSGGIELLPAVSLHVEQGQAFAIRGRNGSGKSTLLRVLNGSYSPTAGSVTVGGADPRRRDRVARRRTASMIGLPPMASDLTVGDHVALVATTWYESRVDVTAVVDSTLESLALSALATRFPHELSSGQTQLFGLALVLARPYEVLLLDEPEQRLDPDRLRLVSTTLQRIRDGGATVVMATHSDTLAREVADAHVRLGGDG